ncbi:putative sporulation transcription regulator WhiA [Moorella thermoacetica]|nr:DNA-binding protein WhiA [Moorella thermoacetica]AKX93092.1 sporulation transcription regulator WhiA [Moorella thermoacetica]AKX95642.1 sporulation transcription regulator WhiA [Moorella thermoacetica]AOQ22763.1 Sporulation transcription regulator WhiA [Moorella thermoacetica]OIQ53474.1 sporulation transcription regulator WhiA [Moorella thermoacetica]QCZ99451.1 Sporulation transcription regulator WhiA [Moorella thermoacetica]
MPLSFSLQTKEELARVKARHPCCRQAELVAFLRLGNLDGGQPGEETVLFTTPYPALARKVYSLAREFLACPVKVRNSRRQGKGRPVFRVVARARLKEIQDWLAGRAGVPEYPCCQAAYMRGAFLVTGSVNKPSGTHHLELIFPDAAMAGQMQGLMQQQELEPRLSRRQRGYVLYLKDSEQIIRALSLMGAYSAVLAYENVLIFKDMRNRVNRLVNCETANLTKTVETGLRQAENIRYLIATVGWDYLPPALREIAAVRLQHPEASLKELGEMLHPPVGKSGVNHRLRRLELIARQVRGQGREGYAPDDDLSRPRA